MRYKKIRAMAWILLLAAALSFWANVPKAAAAGDGRGPDARFSVDITCGIEGYSKYNGNLPVSLTITNHGKDFSGKLRLIQSYEDDSSQRVAYTRELTAASGETLTIDFCVSDMGISPLFDLIILDEEELPCFEQRLRSKIQYSDDVFIGILTNDFDSVSYIDGMPFFYSAYSNYISTRLFALDERNLSDNVSILLNYDAIIINDFDTSSLSASQYAALKDWVSQGGTLIIGTGDHAGETLSLFENDYITGNVGPLSASTSDFSLNGYTAVTRSVPISYSEETTEIAEDDIEITEDDAEAVQAETSVITSTSSGTDDENVFISEVLSDIEKIELDTVELSLTNARSYPQFLCQTLTKGKGCVLVFAFDLGSDAFRSWPHSMHALQNTLTTLTQVASQSLGRFASYNNYYVSDMLTNYISGHLPNIGRFIIIIVIYIILVSPVTYIILRKKDKRQFLWIIVPALAVVFTAVVFLFGNSARQKSPYINYGTIVTSNTGTATEKTYFSVTSPQNKSFEFAVGNGYAVSPLSFYYSDTRDLDPDAVSRRYDMDLNESADGYTIDVQNINAFGSKYFLSEREESNFGQIETDITYVEDHYEGTITNHTGYALENVFLKLDTTLFYIGSLPDGSTYDINDSQTFYNVEYYSTADYVFSEPSDKQRLLQGYSLYMRESYYSGFSTAPMYFLGAFVNSYPVEIADASGYENSGNVLLWDDIEVNYTKDGNYSIPNIFYNSTMLSGDMDSMDQQFYSDKVKFECYIPSEMGTVTHLKLVDPGTEELLYYLYNWESDTYDEVWLNGDNDLNTSQMEPYIRNGCLRICVERVVKDTYSWTALPVISITGREK